MFAQVLPIITLDDWIGSDAAAAEDGGGRIGRPVTGGAMSATGEEHYPQDSSAGVGSAYQCEISMS